MAEQSELPRKEACAFPKSPGVAGCGPSPHGVSAGLGSRYSG